MNNNSPANSSSDSFYDISIESNSIEENFTNRIAQIRRENSRTFIICKFKSFVIFILLFCLISYIIYNYYYKIANGLNKAIL